MNVQYLILCLIGISVLSCNKNKETTPEDIVIARACNKELRLSEVRGLLYFNKEDPKDSIRALHSLAENWCSDACFIAQAKSEIGYNVKIEELVENYKNSLYMDEYERRITKEKTDSTISDDEFMKYYQEKRGEYKLDGPIIKLMYVKIKKKDLDEKVFLPLWNSPNRDQIQLLQKYCSDYAEEYITNGEKWQKWNEINNIFPSRIIDIQRLQKGMQQKYTDKDLYYFLKVYDIVRPNQEPPLSFVKEQAARSILHIKRTKHLEERKKTIYDNALKSKAIDIYIR